MPRKGVHYFKCKKHKKHPIAIFFKYLNYVISVQKLKTSLRGRDCVISVQKLKPSLRGEGGFNPK